MESDNRSEKIGKTNVRQKQNIIYFFGKIEEDSALDFITLLDYNPYSEICIKLHTSGGNVQAAFAMYHAIKDASKTKHITIINEGICNSSGTIVLAAGTVRLARKYSTYLIHDFRKSFSGKQEELRDQLYNVDIYLSMYKEILSTSNFSPEHIDSMMRDERILTSQECLELNIIHAIC